MHARIMQRVGAIQRPLAFGPVGAQTLLSASASTPWAGVQFEVHRSIPGELLDAGPIAGEVGLVVYLQGSVEMTLSQRGRPDCYRAVPGTTAFMAGDEPASARVTGSAEVAAVHLAPQWFHRMELHQAPADFGRK